MTQEEMLAKLTEIGTATDDAARRALITEVTDAVTGIYQSNETLTAANTKYEADNKKLQEYNMQLFLRVGDPTKKKETVDKTGEETKPVLKYENLFNEKGELK